MTKEDFMTIKDWYVDYLDLFAELGEIKKDFYEENNSAALNLLSLVNPDVDLVKLLSKFLCDNNGE